MIFIALFAAVTVVLGLIIIPLPLTPVPITGQTLGMMLAGAVLGKKNGAICMIIFLLLGAAGVPVFAGGRGGLGILAGPSGGYLLSFPLAAWSIGFLLEKLSKPSFWSNFGAMIIGGILLVHILGVAELSRVNQLPWQVAMTQGTLPFIPGDVFKAAVAALLSLRLKPLLESMNR